MKKQNVYTVKDAAAKLMRYCTYRERCHKEVEQKLRNYHLTYEEQQEVISILIAENFLNEERFAKAFANDKFRFNKWGRKRIVRELKFRRISDYLIDKGLGEIDDEEYAKVFEETFTKRWESIHETHPLKKKKKLVDYMYRRGFESELIYDRLGKEN